MWWLQMFDWCKPYNAALLKVLIQKWGLVHFQDHLAHSGRYNGLNRVIRVVVGQVIMMEECCNIARFIWRSNATPLVCVAAFLSFSTAVFSLRNWIFSVWCYYYRDSRHRRHFDFAWPFFPQFPFPGPVAFAILKCAYPTYQVSSSCLWHLHVQLRFDDSHLPPVLLCALAGINRRHSICTCVLLCLRTLRARHHVFSAALSLGNVDHRFIPPTYNPSPQYPFRRPLLRFHCTIEFVRGWACTD